MVLTHLAIEQIIKKRYSPYHIFRATLLFLCMCFVLCVTVCRDLHSLKCIADSLFFIANNDFSKQPLVMQQITKDKNQVPPEVVNISHLIFLFVSVLKNIK